MHESVRLLSLVSGSCFILRIGARRVAHFAVASFAWTLWLLMVVSPVAGHGAEPAMGAASAWSETPHGRVRLIAGIKAVGQGSAVPLALQFDLAPGWKIYWRTPGDAGYPPSIDWQGSANLASAAMLWPSPRRFTILDFETVGYEDAVVLPIEARLVAPGSALQLDATVDYLTCKDICVPHIAQLSLDLPTGIATPSAFADAIAQAVSQVPPVSPADAAPNVSAAAGLAIDTLRLDKADSILLITARANRPFVHPDAFVEGPQAVAFGAPQVALSGDATSAQLSVPVIGEPADVAALAGQSLTLTLVDGDRAVEQARTVVFGEGPAAAGGEVAAPAPRRSFVLVLLLALAGGLILNLMPCVLPVLSIKLLSVVGHGGGDRRDVRLSFLASAAGILFSFLLLAAVLILVKRAGIAAGWGLQFQQPWFLVAMTLVVTLFACNLWGLFEIGTPQALATVDQRVSRRRGLAGHFFTGALATLLATPCSAPFLGTAIGFALAGTAIETLLVFSALAAGLALPYLAVAVMPSLATRLPRPGHWMLWLRRLLGVVLIATGIWLLSILAASRGVDQALVVGGLVLGLVLVLAVGRALCPSSISRLCPLAALAFAVAAFFVPSSGERPAARAGPGWQALQPERIPQMLAEGKTVYVNVTADWCLTCKMNERLVLAREPVASRLADDGIVAMRGDWTQPDEGIARYLAGFGRYGIPFDAVYGAKNPQGTALPELLTTETVINALDAARAAPAGPSHPAASDARP